LPVLEEATPFSYKTTSAAFVGGGSYNVYPLGIESPSHGNRAIVNDPATGKSISIWMARY